MRPHVVAGMGAALGGGGEVARVVGDIEGWVMKIEGRGGFFFTMEE